MISTSFRSSNKNLDLCAKITSKTLLQTKARKIAFAGVLITTSAFALDYYFPISSAGPEYATTTFDQDQTNAFTGANRIVAVMAAARYNTPVAIIKGLLLDTFTISYYDGQIAQFKLVCVPCSVPLEFKNKVSSVPGSSRRMTYPGDPDGFSWFNRDDYYDASGFWIRYNSLFRTSTVWVSEITEIPANCDLCSFY